MRRADIEVPNLAVDMDSWARSACYPRGTFYPLSDTASTSQCRITSPDFRPCSTCLSHSQAPLCTCTRHLIANQGEGGGRLARWVGPGVRRGGGGVRGGGPPGGRQLPGVRHRGRRGLTAPPGF